MSTTPEVTFALGVKSLLPYARYGRAKYVASAVLAVLGTLCQLGPFWVVYRSVSQIVDGTSSRGDLYRLALLGLAFVVVQHVLLAASTWMSHRAAFATLEQLRLSIGDRLGRVPLGFVTSRRSGEIQRTMNDDVERLELFLAHAIPDLVSGVCVVLFTTIWLFVVDWRMALASMVLLVVCLPLMAIGMRRGERKMGAHMASLGRMNGSIVEFVRALPVVRTFNRSDETYTETREAIESSANFQADWGREFLPVFTAFYVLLAANVVTILPVGLWLWQTNRIGSPELVFFFIVGLGYLVPVLKLMEFTSQLSILTIGAGLINELDDAEVLAEVPERAVIGVPTVRVSSVNFAHPAVTGIGTPRLVLDEVSFTAEPGTVTALVGPSGSGKTTMVKLLCRFWDVDAGSIEIGGVDIRQMPFEQHMEQIAFVFQETFLFDDTVAGNIRIGRATASHDDVVEAARAAQAHEFIAALSDGYDTQLGERGARLSGGERQRIAIARALLKNAPIVILDEATAFADPENEAALQDALGALITGRTLIMIAHRLSTIVGADQILVLDAVDGGPGQIVERGSHRTLLEHDGLYARMWRAHETSEGISLGDAVRGELVDGAR